MTQDNHFIFNHNQDIFVVKLHWQTMSFLFILFCYFYEDFFVDSFLARMSRNCIQE